MEKSKTFCKLFGVFFAEEAMPKVSCFFANHCDVSLICLLQCCFVYSRVRVKEVKGFWLVRPAPPQCAGKWHPLDRPFESITFAAFLGLVSTRPERWWILKGSTRSVMLHAHAPKKAATLWDEHPHARQPCPERSVQSSVLTHTVPSPPLPLTIAFQKGGRLDVKQKRFRAVANELRRSEFLGGSKLVWESSSSFTFSFTLLFSLSLSFSLFLSLYRFIVGNKMKPSPNPNCARVRHVGREFQTFFTSIVSQPSRYTVLVNLGNGPTFHSTLHNLPPLRQTSSFF